jgi:hypothetical protein
MSILFSGDFHANAQNELHLITKKTLIHKYKKKIYEGIKYHIILGDGGFLWPDNHKADLYNFEILACRPFPVLCVIGNHEPILGIDDLPETDIGIGEKVVQIEAKPFVAYLKRGKVYTIDGFKMLVLGGALSIDKMYRKPSRSWWEREYWTAEEKRDVLKLLETESEFDCVLSHTGPDRINKILLERIMGYNSGKFFDEVAFLNDEIEKRIQFHEWWCGHFHEDMYYYDKEERRGYQYLYKSTKILDRVDNKMVIYNEFGMSER